MADYPDKSIKIDPDVTKLIYRTLSQIPRSQAPQILTQMDRIERRTFPISEALTISNDLLRKPHTVVGLLITAGEDAIVGYTVVVRSKSTALLHKVCVVEPWRRRGVGRLLLSHLRARLEQGGCRRIQLWVDEGRESARQLYRACGYTEVDVVQSYYGPGRAGIKMVLELGDDT